MVPTFFLPKPCPAGKLTCTTLQPPNGNTFPLHTPSINGENHADFEATPVQKAATCSKFQDSCTDTLAPGIRQLSTPREARL